MQEPILTSFEVTSLEITNAETALFLADAAQLRYLAPFFAKECSLGDAAKQLKLPLANMHYWVNKMEALGLLEQTKTVKRKGSPIKYYRSVADEFSVPLEVIPLASVEELLELRQKPYVKRACKALANAAFNYPEGWHAYYYLAGDTPMYTITPKKGDLEDANIFYLWMPFRLTPEQAGAFRAELHDLQTRYTKLSEENTQETPRYLTHLLSVQDS
jgi:hypothetical protein